MHAVVVGDNDDTLYLNWWIDYTFSNVHKRNDKYNDIQFYQLVNDCNRT